MNVLKGKISNVISKDLISLVEIDTKVGKLYSIVFENTQTALYLKDGVDIWLLFKETSAGIIKSNNPVISSFINQIEGNVEEMIQGEILTEVLVNCKGERVSCVITTKSVKDMDLKVDDKVFVVIKTNEISLESP